MKLILFFNLLFISCDLFALNEMTSIGTKPRVESEIKIAFENIDSVTYSNIVRIVEMTLSQMIKKNLDNTKKLRNSINAKNIHFNINKKFLEQETHELLNANLFKEGSFKFSNFLNKNFTLTDTPTISLFRDIYYDTDSLYLLKKNIIYRLRHRWETYSHYILHQFLPNFSTFYPTRCEIQTKEYRLKKDNFLDAIDTRLEFGINFPKNKNVPIEKKPWSIKKIEKILLSGTYHNYLITPFVQINGSRFNKLLTPKFKLVTTRKRFHIEVENPWGSGVNPRQVILITVDKVSGTCIKSTSCKNNKEFIEIEIEIERNISNSLDSILNTDFSTLTEFEKTVFNSTRLAKSFILKDALFIKEKIASAIQHKLNVKFSSTPTSKIKRFLDIQ